MQGRYRITIVYFIVVTIGILIYLTFLLTIGFKSADKNYKTNYTYKNTESNNLNTELQDTINIINENITTIESPVTIPKNFAKEKQLKKQNNEIYKVKVDILNVRKEPNTKSQILKKYSKNDNIIIIDNNIINNEEQIWGELKSGGFASMPLLERNNDEAVIIAPDEGLKIFIVKAHILNIRENPNIKSKIIEQFEKDDKILIKNISKGWGEVIGGGFAFMEFLEAVN